MPKNGDIRDNQQWLCWVTEAKALSEEALARSRQLLSEPLPDTFLGRQHTASRSPSGPVLSVFNPTVLFRIC